MITTDEKIILTFSRIIPFLSTLEKEKLLSFGEGLAFKVDENRWKTEAKETQLKKLQLN